MCSSITSVTHFYQPAEREPVIDGIYLAGGKKNREREEIGGETKGWIESRRKGGGGDGIGIQIRSRGEWRGMADDETQMKWDGSRGVRVFVGTAG